MKKIQRKRETRKANKKEEEERDKYFASLFVIDHQKIDSKCLLEAYRNQDGGLQRWLIA